MSAAVEMVEVRCPKCNKLLLRVAGLGSMIETKCDRCGAMVRYPSMRPEIFSAGKGDKSCTGSK